jgi:hypothetical protein
MRKRQRVGRAREVIRMRASDMRRLTEYSRTLEPVVIAVLLLSGFPIAGQQQPPAVSHPSTSSVQVTPRQAPSPYGNAPSPAMGVQRAQGTITGFVYWQMNVFQPSSTCQGLTLKVITVTKVGMPLQLLSTTNTLTAAGPMTDTSSPGMPKYMLCSYAFQNMPENVAVRVLLYGAPSSATVSMPSSFQIPGGNCNSTPSGTLSFILTGGQVLCGNGAFNINFKLTSAAVTHPRTTAQLLSETPKAPDLLSNSGSTPDAANQSTPSGSSSGGVTDPNRQAITDITNHPRPTNPNANVLTNEKVIQMIRARIPDSVIVSSIQSSTKQFDFSPAAIQALQQAHVSRAVLVAMCDGSTRCPAIQGDSMPATPGSKVELNPQPFPPGPSGHAGARNGTLPGNRRIPVALNSPKQGSKITNPRAALRDGAIIAVLQQQRKAADAESAAMNPGIRPAGVQTGSAPSQIMAATSVGARGTAPAPNQSSAIASTMKHPVLGAALPAQFNTLALTCSHDPSMRALTVSGGPTPVIFTPDPKYNFYTITGCSFGSPGTNSKAYIYYQGTFREDFQIQQWTDNFIQLSLDQNISGVDDQNNVSLVIQRDDGKQWTKNSYKFYAARQTVLLSSIPQSDFALNKFRPDNAVVASWTPTYTSASSASVVPNLPGLSAEVHWDITRDPKGAPLGGQDNYDFSHLHSTFALDSTSMEWRDVSCSDPNYNQFATSKNNWSIDWYGNSGVQVSWQGQVCNNTWRSCGNGWPVKSDCFEGMPESNYGVNVWVTGPRGIDPWTGKPTS